MVGLKFIVFLTIFSCVARGASEVFFSPNGGCEFKIAKLLDESKSTVDIAIYSLNNSKIIDALKRAKSRRVKIRILLDHTQAAGKGNRESTLDLKRLGFDVRLHSKYRIQHNKFAIFDKVKVVSGSFNWTNPAEKSNEENCMFVDDSSVAASFQKRFSEHLWVVNTERKSDELFKKIRSGHN